MFVSRMQIFKETHLVTVEETVMEATSAVLQRKYSLLMAGSH